MKQFLIYFSLILFFSSCSVLKKKSESETKPVDPSYIKAFHEAVQLKVRGDLDASIAAFEKCLTLRQDDDAVYYALSQLYLLKNDRVRSSENIQKAAKVEPKNIWYTQELAYMYFESGAYAEAVKSFEKLIKYEPRNVEWLYGYAESLVRSGKPSDALQAYNKMEDQVGKHPELSIQKFKLYLEIKQDEKGIQEIEAARKVFPDDSQLIATLVDYYFQKGKEEKAVLMLEELVKADPKNGRAQLALADIYRQRGKQDIAYQYLKNAFTCPDVTIDNKMQILINIHENSFKIDPEVFELVEMVVAYHPEEAKAHSIRGDYMVRAEKDAEALKSYREALKYDKNLFPIWNQVLIMEYQANDFEALYLDSKECLEYFSMQPTVYLLNGVGAVQTKRYAEAIDVLTTGIDFVVNDNGLIAEFNGQLGEAWFGTKDPIKGRSFYEKAVKADPKSLLIKNNFAYRLALANMDLDRALELIDAALEANPDSPNYMDTKGFILFQQGKYQDARTYIEKAYKARPKDKIIVEHMGDVYFKLGDINLGIELWKQAHDLGSSNMNLDKKIEKKEYYDPIY